MSSLISQGSFTSAGTAKIINIPSSADYFVTYNLTQAATTANPGRGIKFEWFKDKTAADAALETFKDNSGNGINANVVTSGGFTYVTEVPKIEGQAANAITGITQANPAVVTQTNTYVEDDLLIINNTTGDLTIGGMVFQISTVSGSGYTLLGLPNTAANGLAAATAGNTRRISKYAAVEPEYLYVTNISNAGSLTTPYTNKAVVSTSINPANYYAVGMKVRFSVPSSFGMTEMDGLTGTITNIGVSNAGLTNTVASTYNFVVDIDVSSFTAFTFPDTTLSPTTKLFATVAPAGAKTSYDPVTQTYTGYNFNLQPFRTGQFVPYMYLAAGAQSPAGSSNDVIVWQAYKMV